MSNIVGMRPSEVLNLPMEEQTFLFDAAVERLRQRPTTDFLAKMVS